MNTTTYFKELINAFSASGFGEFCCFLRGDGQLSKGSEAGCASVCLDTEWSGETGYRANPSSRTGRNRWSLANTGRTVFEISCVSLTAQHRKIIKTLLCWYINTCIYRLFLEGVVFPWTLCATSRSVGKQARPAPDWTSFSGNSWPGQGGGKHCYLKATPSGQQGGRADRETGSVAGAEQ